MVHRVKTFLTSNLITEQIFLSFFSYCVCSIQEVPKSGGRWSLTPLDWGVDDPKKHATSDTCFCTKFRHSLSNHLGVVTKIWGRLGRAPLREGWITPVTRLYRRSVTIFGSKSHRMGAARGAKFLRMLDAAPVGMWNVADPQKHASPPTLCYHAKFGRNRSNRLGVVRGSQMFWGG